MEIFDNQVKLKSRANLHLSRKLWHIGGGVLILSSYEALGFDSLSAGMFLISYSLLNFCFEFLRLNNSRFNQAVLTALGSFMREDERKRVSGMPFYALGAGLSFYLFPEKLAIMSILFLTFSDPISSVVGVLYGKNKFLPNKSIQGSGAGAVVCFLISYLCLTIWSPESSNVIIPFSIAAGLLGSFSELLSIFNLDDNLTIPLFSGLGLLALNNFMQIL